MEPARERFKRTITLLSHGYSCPELAHEGQLTVYPWDADISDWFGTQMRTRGATEREAVVFEAAAKLCGCSLKQFEPFIASEVATVLLTARALVREQVLTYTAICPHCSHASEERVKIPDELGRLGEKAVGYPGWDLIELECGDVVKARPLLVRDELALTARGRPDPIALVAASAAGNKPASRMTDGQARLLAAIVSVNDTTADGPDELLVWFKALPPVDAHKLGTSIAALEPKLDTVIRYTCDGCGKPFTHEVGLDADFFRGPGR